MFLNKLDVCSFSIRIECDYFGKKKSKIKFEKSIWIVAIHKHIMYIFLTIWFIHKSLHCWKQNGGKLSNIIDTY